MKLGSVFEQQTLLEFSGLPCLTIEKPSLENLLNDVTPIGSAYNNAVIQHAYDLAQEILPALFDQNSVSRVAIIDIPRGGVPCAEGVRMACADLGAQTLSISSQCKSDASLLYNPATDWSNIDALILTDGVIGSGETIIKHFEQLPEEHKAKTILLSNVSSELGAKNIGSALGSITSLFTGMVIPEADCQWMQFPEKSVYFIGYNEARGIDLKLPDFGDAIQPRPQPTA